MTDFLRDLFSRPGAARTVIVLEPDTARTPRQYEVRPGYALYAAVIGTVLLAAVLVAVAVLTPLRGLVLGTDPGSLREAAADNAQRAAALEDSLAAQDRQMAQLRAIVTGEMDDLGEGALDPSSFAVPDLRNPRAGPERARASQAAPVGSYRQPAAPLGTAGGGSQNAAAGPGGSGPSSRLSPRGARSRGVDGSRGRGVFDRGAVAGTPVRALGSGHVVLADWTQGGGFTIAVQHPGGYLSVYAHNRRLLKHVGDRVRAREVVALGDTVEETEPGPRLRFEVWRDGRAQDPSVRFLF